MFWRRLAAMARTTVLRTYRQPANLVWVALMPLIFALIIPRLMSFDGPETVAIVDLDGGPTAEAFIEEMAATPLDVTLLSRTEALESIDGGRLDHAFLLPSDFGASVEAGRPGFQVLAGAAYRGGGPVEKRAQGVAAGLAAREQPARVELRVEAPKPAAPGEDFGRMKMVFAFYTMFALATMVNQGVQLQTEKQLGTLQRTLVSGVTAGEVLAGHWLSMTTVGFLQATIILVVTGLLGVPWLAAGWGPLAVLVTATILAAVGLGLGVAGFARTPGQIYGLSGGLSAAATMLGGGFWPLEVGPLSVQKAGRLSPVFWSLEALKEAFVFRGWSGLPIPVAMLLLMAVLGLVVGTAGLRRMMNVT